MQRHSRIGVAEKAARTRVHRADQHEAGGEDGRPRGARDGDAPFLERLAQHLEHVAAELEHLVEKQHAVMGEADFARPRLRSAADERGVRDRVMRRAERAIDAAGRRPGGSSPATECTAVDLERLVEGQRRQDARHAPRHHRLAGAGRTDEQQVVAAGRGDFERAARQQLSAHVRQIRRSRRAQDGGRPGGATTAPSHGSFSARTASASDDTANTSRPDDDRRFAGVGRRQQNAGQAVAPAPPRQSAARRASAWIDPSSDSSPSSTRSAIVPALDDALRRQDAERDRQIERRRRPCARRPARG